ncbi:TnsD family Tn7-like transposition protein [Aliivibrio kagoshimensis]|uniref:TnsD family Tn7-like transposition protein n=1 Tax=Aliivibrio kagoshimensis TaxID=2910230 RepID=UPI003D0B7886
MGEGGIELGGAEECQLSQIISDEFLDTPTALTLTDIYSLYHQQLRELGFKTHCGHIRQRLFKIFLNKKLNMLTPYSTAFQFLASQIQKGQYPECMFYQPNAMHHPVKHYFLIYALFGDWFKFTHCTLKEPPVILKAKQITDCSDKWEAALSRVKSGESLRSVASQYSTTVNTLKIKAQRVGIQVNTRPSKIFKSEERFIWRRLLVGEKTQKIATHLNVSVGAIEKVLNKHPKLKLLRKRIWYLSTFRRHKKQLAYYQQRHSNATRNHIKQGANASYMWLYKHEKQWLYDHLPPEIPRKIRYKKEKS